MKSILKKTMVIGISILFFVTTTIPALSAVQEHSNEKDQEISISELPSIKQNSRVNQTISKNTGLVPEDLSRFISRLSTEGQDLDTIRDLIEWLLNKSEYPFLSFLISQIFQMNRLQDRYVIISFGWNYNLNPFKQSELELIRPLTIWQYTTDSTMFTIPSTTILISGDPFNIETVFGNQLGMMFRFRGIFGRNPEQRPQQSLTYMIGTVQNAWVVELPSFEFFSN